MNTTFGIFIIFPKPDTHGIPIHKNVLGAIVLFYIFLFYYFYHFIILFYFQTEGQHCFLYMLIIQLVFSLEHLISSTSKKQGSYKVRKVAYLNLTV